MDEDTELIEAVKGMSVDVVRECCRHFVDGHTTSEREMELIAAFADTCVKGINSIKKIGA